MWLCFNLLVEFDKSPLVLGQLCSAGNCVDFPLQFHHLAKLNLVFKLFFFTRLVLSLWKVNAIFLISWYWLTNLCFLASSSLEVLNCSFLRIEHCIHLQVEELPFWGLNEQRVLSKSQIEVEIESWLFELWAATWGLLITLQPPARPLWSPPIQGGNLLQLLPLGRVLLLQHRELLLTGKRFDLQHFFWYMRPEAMQTSWLV